MSELTHDKTPQYFLELIQRSKRGKLKIYIGMSAGVGKTYRMLQEAHSLMQNGINVMIGFIETHQRKETQALVEGLAIVPRKQVFYKGRLLEEMDLQDILMKRPDVVLVDELAHSNIPGSKHEKRWQDVIELLDAGINVISAVNIQHLESLNEAVKKITGIEVQERIPDYILAQADEVVNIDLTAQELIHRLKAGKIYQASKIESALNHFFKQEHILQLRELALKEVASQVERKVEAEVAQTGSFKHEKLLACISTNEKTSKHIIRRTARLANHYHCPWSVLYVQTAKEDSDKIKLASQRHLMNSLKLALELGAEVLQVHDQPVSKAILKIIKEKKITTVFMGKPNWTWWRFHFFSNPLAEVIQQAPDGIEFIVLT